MFEYGVKIQYCSRDVCSNFHEVLSNDCWRLRNAKIWAVSGEKVTV